MVDFKGISRYLRNENKTLIALIDTTCNKGFINNLFITFKAVRN